MAGKRMDEVRNVTLIDSSINLLIESAQLSEVKIGRIDSVYYEILLDANNQIKFISTSDTLFKTKEGLKVGNTYGDLKKRLKVKKKRIINYAGWGKVLKLNSGWLAVFDFNETVQAGSPILFFYQRSN